MADRQFLDPAIRGPKVDGLATMLRAAVVGQVDAIDELVRCFVRFRAGLAPGNRPVGVFLLAGPTGVGKTLLAQEFVRAIGHSPDSLLRIDGAEYGDRHEIAKLIGAPPGYLGHRETTPVITQAKLSKQFTDDAPCSIVLFDEIEKAHGALWDLLLGILDNGQLRTGEGNIVDFCNTIVLLTTNLGQSQIVESLAPRWGLGAGANAPEELVSTAKSLTGLVDAAVRRTFKPEFVNRIDKVLTFKPLAATEIREIFDLQLTALIARLAASGHPLALKLTPAAVDFLIADGIDLKYGARHLRRSLMRNLEEPLANLIVSGQLGSRSILAVDCGPTDPGPLTFEEL